MYVYMNVVRVENNILVAVCDQDLLDTTLIDGNKKIKISAKFYGKRRVHIDDEELIENLKSATMTNLIGTHIIAKAIELGIIHKNAIIKVAGIPHAISIVAIDSSGIAESDLYKISPKYRLG